MRPVMVWSCLIGRANPRPGARCRISMLDIWFGSFIGPYGVCEFLRE